MTVSVILTVMRAKQPGLLPKIIQILTKSKWNHVFLKIENDKSSLPSTWYLELDYNNPEQIFTQIPETWEVEELRSIKISESDLEWIKHKRLRYTYSMKYNLYTYLAFLFNFVRKRLQQSKNDSFKVNCVGFVERILQKQLSYTTPGEAHLWI